VAKVIEFYIPARFQKRVKWSPSELRGKLIKFRPSDENPHWLKRERKTSSSRSSRWLSWP